MNIRAYAKVRGRELKLESARRIPLYSLQLSVLSIFSLVSGSKRSDEHARLRIHQRAVNESEVRLGGRNSTTRFVESLIATGTLPTSSSPVAMTTRAIRWCHSPGASIAFMIAFRTQI